MRAPRQRRRRRLFPDRLLRCVRLHQRQRSLRRLRYRVRGPYPMHRLQLPLRMHRRWAHRLPVSRLRGPGVLGDRRFRELRIAATGRRLAGRGRTRCGNGGRRDGRRRPAARSRLRAAGDHLRRRVGQRRRWSDRLRGRRLRGKNLCPRKDLPQFYVPVAESSSLVATGSALFRRSPRSAIRPVRPSARAPCPSFRAR